VVSFHEASPPNPCIHFSSPPYLLLAPPILFHLVNRIIFDEECRSLSSSLWSFFYFPATSSLLGPNILLSTLFSNTLLLRTSLNISDHDPHPYKTTGKIIILYVLIFIRLDSQMEDNIFCTVREQSIPWCHSALTFFLSDS
jgi:hypothetical protein